MGKNRFIQELYRISDKYKVAEKYNCKTKRSERNYKMYSSRIDQKGSNRTEKTKMKKEKPTEFPLSNSEVPPLCPLLLTSNSWEKNNPEEIIKLQSRHILHLLTFVFLIYWLCKIEVYWLSIKIIFCWLPIKYVPFVNNSWLLLLFHVFSNFGCLY